MIIAAGAHPTRRQHRMVAGPPESDFANVAHEFRTRGFDQALCGNARAGAHYDSGKEAAY